MGNKISNFNPSITWKIKDASTDSNSYPKVVLRQAGSTPNIGLSLISYINSTSYKFNDIIDIDGKFLPDYVKITNLQLVSSESSSAISNGSTIELATNFTTTSNASSYIAIPLCCNYGLIQNYGISANTLTMRILNVSGGSHKISYIALILTIGKK